MTLTALNAQKEPAEVAVPYDPQRIAVLDMATLDILDALGVGGRVVGAADTSLDYLQNYVGGEVSCLGTIKEAGLEDTAGELMTGFDSRVAALASFSEG